MNTVDPETNDNVRTDTARVELLLKAALLAGDTARAAWQEWRDQVDFENDLDWTSCRLLPIVYKNLKTLQVQDPLLGKMKGVYRRAWCLNHALFHSAATALRALHEAGIEALLLKGAALTLLYYKDYGLRPMQDLDVLVPIEKRAAAFEALRKAGWQPRMQSSSLEKATEESLDFLHAWNFDSADNQSIDLHWHAFPPMVARPIDDHDLWSGAVPIAFGDIPSLALNPADQLLHVCAHGGGWSGVSSMLWVPDAIKILDAAGSLDWNRIVRQAEQRELTLPVFKALLYIKTVIGAQVPEDVLKELRSVPVSPAKQKFYGVIAAPEGLLGSLPLRWHNYVMQTELSGRTRSPRIFDFIRHIQRTEGKSYKELLTWAIGKSLSRLTRHVRS